MPQKWTVERLNGIRRIRGISDDSKNLILQSAFEKRLESGQVLVRQGDAASTYYLIESGYIKWERGNSHGVERLLDIYGPCETPGELAVRLQSAFPASGIAVAPCVLLGIDQSLYVRLIKSDLRFAEITSICLAGRAHSLLGRIAEEAEPSIDERVAAFLLRLVFKFGVKKGEGWIVPFSLPRADIAKAAGCRTETVIRVMRRWEKDNKMIVLEKEMTFIAEFVEELREVHEDASLPFGSECSRCPERSTA